MELKQLIDRLYLKSSDDIAKLTALNRIQPFEGILHDSFDTLILRKVQSEPKYLDKDWELISTDLIAMATALVPEQMTTEKILSPMK